MDISIDPRIDEIFAELAEESISMQQKYNWPVERLFGTVTIVAARRIFKLETELAKLKRKQYQLMDDRLGAGVAGFLHSDLYLISRSQRPANQRV